MPCRPQDPLRRPPAAARALRGRVAHADFGACRASMPACSPRPPDSCLTVATHCSQLRRSHRNRVVRRGIGMSTLRPWPPPLPAISMTMPSLTVPPCLCRHRVRFLHHGGGPQALHRPALVDSIRKLPRLATPTRCKCTSCHKAHTLALLSLCLQCVQETWRAANLATSLPPPSHAYTYTGLQSGQRSTIATTSKSTGYATRQVGSKETGQSSRL